MKYIFVIILLISLPSTACIQPEGWQDEIMEKTDTDKDGYISYEEYKNSKSDSSGEDILKRNWEQIANGKGKATKEEYVVSQITRKCGGNH